MNEKLLKLKTLLLLTITYKESTNEIPTILGTIGGSFVAVNIIQNNKKEKSLEKKTIIKEEEEIEEVYNQNKKNLNEEFEKLTKAVYILEKEFTFIGTELEYKGKKILKEHKELASEFNPFLKYIEIMNIEINQCKSLKELNKNKIFIEKIEDYLISDILNRIEDLYKKYNFTKMNISNIKNIFDNINKYNECLTKFIIYKPVNFLKLSINYSKDNNNKKEAKKEEKTKYN